MEKKTIISRDIKLRHSTGAYLHMDDAPTEEDMLFFLGAQKHKTAEIKAINKAFGEHKSDVIESMLRHLEVRAQIKRSGDQSDIITLV